MFSTPAQQCPSVNVPSNVDVIGDAEEATHGNVVQFSCKSSNHILTGAREIYCDENGDWKGLEDGNPKCDGKIKFAFRSAFFQQLNSNIQTSPEREYSSTCILYI